VRFICVNGPGSQLVAPINGRLVRGNVDVDRGVFKLASVHRSATVGGARRPYGVAERSAQRLIVLVVPRAAVVVPGVGRSAPHGDCR
jgi:hypothetical protein